jgi:hypothetical protein
MINEIEQIGSFDTILDKFEEIANEKNT